MKNILEKPSDDSQSTVKDAGTLRASRSRGRKRSRLFGANDVWRALSSASLTAPHTPILRRLHD